MRLGATLVHLADAPPFPVADWARRLVAAGFDSLWTPHVLGRGPLVPDPFTTLAVAAAATDEVELGTATVQVPLFHPADLAHRVLSLMAVCGDRLTLGVSPGSSEADYATVDRPYATRFQDFRRSAARLRVLVQDGRDQHATLGPAPARIPPFLLGSWGANVERAARDFDGWLASGYRTTPDEIVAAHDRFRAAGGQRAVVCTVPADAGELASTHAVLRRYAEAGFDDAVVLLSPSGATPEQVAGLRP